jgi:hypothetical protein
LHLPSSCRAFNKTPGILVLDVQVVLFEPSIFFLFDKNNCLDHIW